MGILYLRVGLSGKPKIMEFLSNENLMLSYRQAKKSRKDKQEVYIWDLHFEENILKLKSDLELGIYEHSEYKNIILFDSKKRYISSPKFRDHIVHHMVHNIIYGVFNKILIDTTYACRKGYGSHKAVHHLKEICKKFTYNTDSYYLKMDISKYFYSVNHTILKQIIFKRIKNNHLRFIIEIIIDSYRTKNQFDHLFSPDSKYIKNKKKGLPIGSIISQLFANVYLSQLDAFIKHDLKIKYYLRYMDDLLLIGDKNTLQNAKTQIIDFVYNHLDLTINPKKNSFNRVSDGVKFVGYRVYKEKIYVGKNTKIKTNKFLDNIQNMNGELFSQKDMKKIESSLNSRLGVFKQSDFKLNYFKKRGNIDIPSWG